MVSIIIPVFETEEYLSQCLNSVVNQTYRDIEIILVVADSQDNSLSICEDYEKKDNRIRIITQSGNGTGAARNQGVSEAQGEFICFVDSDDWVSQMFVERMVNTILDNEVDFVECDYYYGPNGNERIGGNSPYATGDMSLLNILGTPACWKQMYRKSFWNREGLYFANTVAEDLYLYSCLYRLGNTKIFLNEALYYYRIRSGSFSDSAKKSIEKYHELFNLFKMLVEQYKNRGLFQSYYKELYRELVPHANIRYRAICSRISKDYAMKLKRMGREFFETTFDRKINSFSIKVMALGGYNLGRVVNYISCEDISKIRYSFSSIVSIMSDKSRNFSVVNSNQYRQSMIDKDINGVFVNQLEKDSPNLIIIDFIEERFNIIRYEDCCYTYSDAFEESSKDISEYDIIDRFSAECDALWKSACNGLIRLINALDEKCTVILLESYLSDYIGNIYKRDKFDDEYIVSVNSLLKSYYDYFESNCNRIKVIRESEIPDKYKYTEETFEHGARPEHLNKYYFGYVANIIMDYIEEDFIAKK